MQFDEKTISRENIYQGKIISLDTLEVMLPDGSKSVRDIVSHPGASAVIAINDANELYMVRQYRKAIERTTLEIPAGKLDSGENPEKCAVRELKEETGLKAGKVRYITSIHSTPGFCNEVLHLFVAAELSEGQSCSDSDEFIASVKIPVKRLVDMVLKHEITDAKTVIGILLAEKIVKGEICI